VGDPDLEAVDQRIEYLLERLGSLPDRRPLEWAESLVRTLTDLYGEGLRRTLAAAPPGLLQTVAGDELVSALLVLHGLHPESLRQRVDDALATLPRLLGVEDARVVEADEADGRVQIRVLLAPGARRNRDAVEKLVRETVEKAAPDALSVVIDCPDTGIPVQLKPTRPQPVDAARSAPVVAGGGT
jgi:hypothetical protein